MPSVKEIPFESLVRLVPCHLTSGEPNRGLKAAAMGKEIIEKRYVRRRPSRPRKQYRIRWTDRWIDVARLTLPELIDVPQDGFRGTEVVI